MSGTNGVMDGVNGSAASALAGQLQDARAEAKIWSTQAGLYLADFQRVSEKYRSSQADNARLAAELATVQAECCRLTDVNGDLGAAHERLMGAALSVLRSGVSDGDGAKVVVAAYWFDRLASAVRGDLIDPSFEPDALAGPVIGSIDAVWFARLGEAVKRLYAAWANVPVGMAMNAEISDVLETWGDRGDVETTPQPPEPVNARLLAAAKWVDESSEQELRNGNYGSSWTGVDDDALAELFDAVNAAQGEGESAEPVNGVNAAQIIREQSERIKTLELELEAVAIQSDKAQHIVRVQDEAIAKQAGLIESLGQVSAAARDFRLAWRSGEKLQGFYDALDFALDGLPKGGEAAPCQSSAPSAPVLGLVRHLLARLDHAKTAGGLVILPETQAIMDELRAATEGVDLADAPCQASKAAPCGQTCQASPPQVPCPERVHMLAVAARNLIVAKRQGRLTQCEINTLDFALDGLI